MTEYFCKKNFSLINLTEICSLKLHSRLLYPTFCYIQHFYIQQFENFFFRNKTKEKLIKVVFLYSDAIARKLGWFLHLTTALRIGT